MKTLHHISAAVLLSLALPPLSSGAVRYVNVNNASPTPPYTNWATAATVIQDAIDAAVAGDEIVVTNGIYETGGRVVYGTLTNRVAVTKPLTVRSVNGPEVTVIRGEQWNTNGGAMTRCAYLTNGAVLLGFTLTNGAASGFAFSFEDYSGGGVWCESVSSLVSNCVISGNYAWVSWPNNEIGNTYSIAGGAYRGTLQNCVLTGNSADYGGGATFAVLERSIITRNSAGLGGGAAESALLNCVLMANDAWSGGGACNSSLNNCTIAANSAFEGGGITSRCPYFDCISPISVAKNCILFDNTANVGANYHGDGGPVQRAVAINYSCTTPLPTSGASNISNAPLFVNSVTGTFRLQSNSPCINAGRNAAALAGLDLDGNPRIAGGTVDMGAYEFQSPQSALSYAWLQHYGLPTDGSVDLADLDADGHDNWMEWRAWTDPTNSTSALRLLTPTVSTNGLLLRWQSVGGQTYFLERSSDLGAQPSFVLVDTNIVGQAGTTVFTDTNAVGTGPFFYRVGVK